MRLIYIYINYAYCFIFLYQDPILEEQAQQERSEPLWPKLQATTQGTCVYAPVFFILCSMVIQPRNSHCMFTGKTLIACKTAVKNFTSILETVGGPQEKKRGRLLQIDLKLAVIIIF